MAKKRKKRRSRGRRKMTALQRKYFGGGKRSTTKKRRKHHRKGHHVAKRRRSHRRHSGRRSRRRHSGGGGGGIKGDIPLLVAGAVIGFGEKQAKADANFLLNKIPRPIAQLGYTGGTALALYLAAHIVPGSFKKYLKLGARAAATAAAYQMGKLGTAFTDTTLSGDGRFDGDGHLGAEHLVDENLMGALDVEGSIVAGLPFESSVHDAEEHT